MKKGLFFRTACFKWRFLFRSNRLDRLTLLCLNTFHIIFCVCCCFFFNKPWSIPANQPFLHGSCGVKLTHKTQTEKYLIIWSHTLANVPVEFFHPITYFQILQINCLLVLSEAIWIYYIWEKCSSFQCHDVLMFWVAWRYLFFYSRSQK